MKQIMAIFSPSKNAYSETFIQAHKQLPFDIRFYYDGNVPAKLENSKELLQFNLFEKLKNKLNKGFNFREHALIKSLREQKVNCVLAEYGTTACDTLPVVKHLGLPLIVHFHGFDASVKIVLEQYSEQYKKVFAYASAIIAVSKTMKKALIQIGCPAEKIFMSIYGPAEEFFNIKPKYNTQQFVAVGRFVEKKAPYISILAFKKVLEKYPDSSLVMIGEGELLNVCKDLAKALQIESKIKFAGVLSPDKVRSVFEDSIAFVQHSVIAQNGDSEGTPVAILEAQAASLPVIATRHAGISDVVLNNETGFLTDELDIDGMVKNMITVLKEAGLAKKIGSAAKSRMMHHFTLKMHLTTLTKIIKQTIH